MHGFCLLVAGALRATMPDSELTLKWEHSVEKVEWQERYVVEHDRLRLVEAKIRGSGAGMEAPSGAVLRDGAWTWQPSVAPLQELRLTYSTYTPDYRLCSATTCTALAELAAPLADGATVTVRACP